MPEEDISTDIVRLISAIKHGNVFSSYEVAKYTEEYLEALISKGQWKNAQELMLQIKDALKQMRAALPLEGITAANVMLHILKVIREEYELGSEKKAEGQSLQMLVKANPTDVLDFSEPSSNLKTRLLDHLTEYKVELESSTHNIAAQAVEHIHTNEIILTVGKSSTVERFLKFAGETRNFQVIVVEGGPTYFGHKMAQNLAKSKIQTTLISDSAVFAMMSRVNKVIIGTHSVMADGGLRAASGLHAVALAAKHYSVPVMVLAHMYKLTPAYVSSHEKDSFNICMSPANTLPYATGPIVDKIDILTPTFDYVPPELVTLFISHQGGNAPSYVYRLLSELYHPDDYEL